ncbi:MAG: transcription termination/antitermination protein NusG [Tepidisphaerales bacterium]
MTVSDMPMEGGIETAVAADVFPDASCGLWYVLHTKSRQEKVVADGLAAMGIAHFLPLLKQVRYYGNRKAWVDLPLFPGYVFLRGAVDHVYEADRTKRIAQIIKVHQQDKLDWELRNLHVALVAKVPLTPFPYLKAGVRVEVRSGPFRGLQGVIEGRTPKDRLLLQVDILGQAVSVEIDGSLLDVIE